MRRVRFSAAVSLDGYIAGPKGEHDWIVSDPDIDFRALMSSFDTLLLGRKTYQGMRGHGGGKMPGMRSYVFSRTLRQEDCPGVTLSQDPAATVTALKTAAGRDIWLFGGGELLRSLLELRLVDSIELAVVPVLLGDGIPLAPNLTRHVRLRLTRHKILPKTGTVSLEYTLA